MKWKIKTSNDPNIMIEPIIIYAGDLKWVHPEIDSILEWGVDYAGDKVDEDTAMRDIYKVYLKRTEKIKCPMVIFYCKVENEIYPSLKSIEGQLAVCIHEDVWSPGGDQFIFTEIGSKISELLPIDIEVESWSPDAGIQRWIEEDRSITYEYCS